MKKYCYAIASVLCEKPEDYWYSSARYYELNEDDWGFLTQYEEHL